MDFKLNKEHEMLRKAVRDYARKELAPTAFERDEETGFDRGVQFDKLAELDLPGIIFPETYGGAEADYISYVIAVEELSRVCASTGVVLSSHISLSGNPINIFGTEEQKQKFLKPMAEGLKLGCLGLNEASAGSDLYAMEATAVRDGDDWILNGTKKYITNGGDAEVVVALFKTGEDQLTAFVLEKDTPGLSAGKTEDEMGCRASVTRELIFSDCRVFAENLLGKEGQGYEIAMKALDSARIGIAAQALGIAQGAYEEAAKYAKQRFQFGRPIREFQAIEFKLVDMASQIEAIRFIVYRAAWCADNNLPYTKEAAMAKMMASDMAMAVTTDAVQIHGGNGYAKDYSPERMLRDAKMTQLLAGTNEIQRVTIGSLIK